MHRVSGLDLSDYLQITESECGVMCLGAATRVLKSPVDPIDIRRDFSASVRGTSVTRLCEVAQSLGMLPMALSCEAREIREIAMPAVAHWKSRHFVLVLKAGRRAICLFDPSVGMMKISFEEFERNFSGSIVSLQRASSNVRRPVSDWARFRSIASTITGVKGKVAQLLLLSLIVQLVALAIPLLSIVLINQGAMAGVHAIVAIVAGCLVLVHVVGFLVESWRAALNQRLSMEISDTLSQTFFIHLVSLPLAWFEKRRISEIISRFDSIEPLRAMLGTGFVTITIDGVLAALLSVTLIAVSPLLGLVVITSIAGVVVAKVIFSRAIAKHTAAALSHKISENSRKLESVQCIQLLKLAAFENRQAARWGKSHGEFLRASGSAQMTTAIQHSFTNLSSALGMVLTIYVGAGMVASSSISIGALFAFIMYRRYLQEKATAVVDQLNAFWLMRLHVRRLSEVFSVESEHGSGDSRDFGSYVSEGSISLQNVSFRYSQSDPYVVSGLNLEVPPGEVLLINGVSGAGKSTLVKLICGLYVPTSGDVLVDEVSTKSIPLRSLRGSVVVVSQEDQLLSGTVFENVTMFDVAPDLDEACRALELCGALDMVKSLPLGLHTPVGEAGRLLSAGQRQRLLVARAIYRRPRVLILDEATSNLDPESEGRMLRQLRSLGCTFVIISHRVSLREVADRVVHLSARGLKAQGRVIVDALEA